MRLQFWIALLFLCATGSWVQSQESDSSPTTAHIRFSHFVETMPSLDIFLNENQVISGLAYASTSRYNIVEVGSYEIIVGDNTIDSLDVIAGSSYLIILDDTQGALQATIIDETTIQLDSDADSVPFIIYNATPNPIMINKASSQKSNNISPATYGIVGFSDNVEVIISTEEEEIILSPHPLIPNIIGFVAVTQSDNRIVTQTTLATPMSLFEFILMNSEGAAGLMFMSGFNILIPTDEALTFFLPTDAGFAKLPVGVDAGGTGEAAFLLLHHTIQGDYTLKDLAELQSIPTLHGAELSLATDDNTLIINNSARIFQDQLSIQVENVRVYLIDDVLLPPQLTTQIVDMGVVSIGETIQGQFNVKERHRYSLNADRDASLNIHLSNDTSSIDTYLRIYNAKTGEIIAENDDLEGINAGILALSVQTGDAIIIEAATYGDGSEGFYQLTIEENE